MDGLRMRGGSVEPFWRSLAEKIGVRLVVFVTSTDRARVLWIAQPEQPLEAAALADTGRSALAALRGGSTGNGAAPGFAEESSAAPVRGHDGEVSGVLIASKNRGTCWSDEERALLEFAADFFADDLVVCAAHPRPSNDLHPTRRRGGGGSQLEAWLRAAPGRGELFLLFQPEVDLTTGAIVAVEALLRWAHPLRGKLDPDAFISIAEQSDLISVLGTWVLEESLRAFAGWQAELTDNQVMLRVNVSPVQLVGDGIVDVFADALARHGVRGDRLCVEITENVRHVDADDLALAVRALKGLGITSAIDDLATGYSTLGRLRALPVDTVKIDRSLVTDVDSDPRARSIVAAIITLGAELGVEVVAEGVETEAESDTLVALGCRRAQGHLFARPMPSAEIAECLRVGRLTPSSSR